MLRRVFPTATLLALVLGTTATAADHPVPGVLAYQGSLADAGKAIQGTVHLKLALVGSDGTSLWSHDGSSVGGSEPATAVAVVANRGLFSVMLGDTSIPHMTVSVPASAFQSPDVRLRLWASTTGASGPYTLLSPDTRIAAVGYALKAQSVTDGAIGAAQLVDGAISLTESKIVGVLPLARGGTGATTADAARTNLGLGSAATASTADFATAAQGAKADTAVQPSDLAPLATASAYLAKSDNLAGLAHAPTARANLGLGSAATAENTAFATAAQGTKADTAVQPGTLGSAALQPSSAFATAAQGTKADTAVQPGTLGSAALQPSTAFATAAQGTKADTAVQPGTLGSAALQPSTAFANAAQGTKADSAVQPGDLGSAATASSSDFATAAQGAKADTAVQPAALGATATLTARLDATTAPVATDDDSQQFAPGSLWVDRTAGRAYLCVDATTNAAVWRDTTATLLDAGTITSGTLPVARGGTGTTTSAGALAALLPDQTGKDGQVLTSAAGTAAWSTPMMAWTVDGSTSVTTAGNRGYLLSSATQVAATLPSSPSAGQAVRIAGAGSGGWRLLLQAGQTVALPTALTVPSGITWTTGSSTKTWVAMAASASGLKVAAIASGALWTSTDGGTTWTVRATGQSWNAITSSDDGSRLAATISTAATVYLSTDSGANWTTQSLPGTCQSIASSSSGTILVAANSGTNAVYRSSDSGANWTTLYLTTTSPQAVATSADGTVIHVADYSRVVSSSDSGSTWSTTSMGLGWMPSSICTSANGTSVTVVGNNLAVSCSSNGGASFTNRESARAWRQVACSDDGMIQVATVNGGSLYVSNNGGVTWTARDASRAWSAVTASASGRRMLAAPINGVAYIHANTPSTTSNLSSSDAYVLTGAAQSHLELVFSSSTSALVINLTGTVGLE